MAPRSKSRINAILGYATRPATRAERDWFSRNLRVAGYAAEDRAIVLNPCRKLSKQERRSVCLNEAIRLLMREWSVVPEVALTKKQLSLFRGTAYQDDDAALRQTVIARIIAGDPSSGAPTAEQLGYANCFRQIAFALRR
jgi:hypothetical protein